MSDLQSIILPSSTDSPLLLQGDCRELLVRLPESSVDSIVTDPPYEVGIMNHAWDRSGVTFDLATWRACLRVLKPGGHLLAFSLPRIYHRLAIAVEDAGFEVRDQIMWVFGSGMPKSHNLRGEWEGWGTSLKPAHEPIVLARKPLEGTVAANMQRLGVGALNIDASRVPGEPVPINRLEQWSGFGQLKRPDYEQEINTKGRWPANLIHDGSEEVVDNFPSALGQLAPVKFDDNERKTQHVYGAMKRGRSEASRDRRYTDKGATNFAMKPGDRRMDGGGSAARFFYCAKASKSERNRGLDANEFPLGNPHSTVKPIELMEYLIRLVTPEGGVVVDPFVGSGSTGVAAKMGGWRFIGMDLSEEYLQIAHGRMAASDPGRLTTVASG